MHEKVIKEKDNLTIYLLCEKMFTTIFWSWQLPCDKIDSHPSNLMDISLIEIMSIQV